MSVPIASSSILLLHQLTNKSDLALC